LTSNQAFIGVDWGTSSFRAALIAADGDVLDELSTPHGILGFERNEFVPYMLASCERLTLKGGKSFLLSGMIGSKNGLLETSYCPCPTKASDIATALGWVETANADLTIAVAPGVRQGFDDVMRGEETQVFGAVAILGLQNATFVLPGTHSKWVQFSNGAITKFNTFMTGEFYALLSQHSILAKSLPESSAQPATFDVEAFLQGIDRAQTKNLINASSHGLLCNAFSTRVKSLFNQLSPAQAASYLSGLIIGEELAAMRLPGGSDVVVIGSPTLCDRYNVAFKHLGVITRAIGNQAAWAGLHSIYSQMLTRK
jgi:2-dehydro-3-deoxygalactonokinase